ncbi:MULTISPECIES: type II toxin-antitoxin system RelE/ParE family toxin [Thalassolituus]|uniref:type II toxin-antitoxin system RelE/ParE family toxin n=1 Tax=Thalassolituus TaxID=187492 RepID=UPI0023F20A70|nr:type II toxin-antitoxin system RelE/ParE family toxin [Thalassolituus oleivorans]MDF1868157.1 type II toxin-antitoxin system RelE/ParE family toxin [Saprospiraceae bacterium]
MSYTFHPAAEAELLEAIAYYESKVSGLGEALIMEFETLTKLLQDNPHAWQVLLEPNIRRVPLRSFPMSVIYRIQNDSFQVLAISHDRKRPYYWLKRSNT